MKIFIQWARRNPIDWQLADSDTWTNLAKKAYVEGVQPLNNQNGWLTGVNMQGVDFSGNDHFHVVSIPDGVRVTVWMDNLTYNPPGMRLAQVWDFLSLAPDPRFGGQLNTRQSRVVYLDTQMAALWPTTPPENTVYRTWSEFVPPPEAQVRHGVGMSDADWTAHMAARTEHGWREWAT